MLGSNFLDEATTHKAPSEQAPVGPIERGIELTGLATPRRPLPEDNLAFGPSADESGSFLEYARFIGFRMHSVYWDRESENALSCFGPLVHGLYAKDLILA